MYDSLLEMLIDQNLIRNGFYVHNRRFVFEPAYNKIGVECHDIRTGEYVTFDDVRNAAKWVNKK